MQAIRPQALSLSVSQGKGRSRTAASISALMEALELHHAETVEAGHHALPSPDTLALWNRDCSGALAADAAVGWVAATDLLSGRPCPVPHALVSMDCTRDEGGLRAISTGLAGGNDRDEAVEVALAEIRGRACLHAFNAAGPAERRALEVAPASLPGRATAWALARLAAAGVGLRCWELAPGAPFPVILATLFGGGGATPLPPALGVCCADEPGWAAFGAIAEAAQARVTLLAGARDDIEPGDYDDPAGKTLRLLLGAVSLGASERPCRPAPEAPAGAAARERLLGLLEEAGAAAVAVADLAQGPLCFVKAIAPGVPDGERRAA
jgi:ribosomal protein S12 methylthiotransferase accessory factor